MSRSSDQTHILNVLAAQLQATDPELARQLTGPPGERNPGPGHPKPSPMSRRPAQGAVDFLQVVGAVLVGVATLLIGVYLRSSWLIALGIVVVITLPVAAIWWVNARQRRP